MVGLVPKIFLPTANEYYEQRWFTSGAGTGGAMAALDGAPVPFGVDLLFCGQAAPRVPGRNRDLRGPVDRQPAQRRVGPWPGATILVNPVGQRGAARQVRLPPRPGAPAIGPLPGRLRLRRGRSRRIHHRPVVFSGHGLIAEKRGPFSRGRAVPVRHQLHPGRRGRGKTWSRSASATVSFSAAAPHRACRRLAFDLADRPLPETLLRPALPHPLRAGRSGQAGGQLPGNLPDPVHRAHAPAAPHGA